MASKAEQSEATKAALLGAARRLFSARGFAETSVEAIVAAAGVTKGALYHQFDDKVTLFQAVFEQIEADVVNHLVAAVDGIEDPIKVLRRGAGAFLDACLDPAVRRIALVEAPAVLGWERWRELEQAYGLGVAKLALQGAMDAGAIRRQPVDPLAHVLFGAIVEGALVLATAEEPKAARRDVGRVVAGIIDGLSEASR